MYGLQWYEIILICSGGFMIIQTILSFIAGEFDFDADMDADVDFDFGDYISFKGFVHYLVGFSVTMTTFGNTKPLTWGVSAIVGLIFVVILHALYIYIYRKLSVSLEYTKKLNDVDAEVYFWDKKAQIGEVFVTLEGRKLPITLKSKKERMSFSAGDKIKVSGTRDAVYKS